MNQPPAESAPIRAERVRGALYVLRGGGRLFEVGGVALPQAGNSALFVASRGAVLVDTKLPGSGAALLGAVRSITDAPLAAVVNTHAHVDHVGGNPELPDGVDIVAHAFTAAAMREMRPVTGGAAQPNPFAAGGGRGLPTRTFAETLTLFDGDDRVELRWFGPAHTGGDAWVVFPALRAAHSGDAFAHKTVPLVDVNNGGSGAGYPGMLARAAEMLEEAGVDTIVAGHYPGLLTLRDLEAYARFTRELAEAVRAAKREGRTVDDFVRDWTIPAREAAQGYVSFAHLRPLRADVETLWKELS